MWRSLGERARTAQMLWVRTALLLCARSSSTLLVLGACVALGWSGAEAHLLVPLASAWAVWTAGDLPRLSQSIGPSQERTRIAGISVVPCILAGATYSASAGSLALSALCESWGWTFFLLRLAPSPGKGTAIAALVGWLLPAIAGWVATPISALACGAGWALLGASRAPDYLLRR